MPPNATHNRSEMVAFFVLAVLLIGFVGHSYFYLFVQDDAYIFFRYAENWTDGFGPVWNQGERVEGYSSPAWLLILTVVRLLVGAFEPQVHFVTVGLGLASLVLVFRLARSMTGDVWAGIAAVLLTASDRTFALWSTSGMETRLFGLSILLVAALVERARERGVGGAGSAVALAVALLLLCLSRPDGLLFAGVLLGYVVVQRSGLLRERWALISLATWVAGVAAHLVWRWLYYGSLVPNTFYAKVSGTDFHRGADFFMDFAESYPMFSVAVVLAAAWHLGVAVRKRELTFELALVVTCSLYFVYLMAVGGGFMEFRFLDAAIPIVSLLVVSALWPVCFRLKGPLRYAVAVTLVVTLASANLSDGATFENDRHTVMTRHVLWYETTVAWIEIGKWFHEIALPEESIATTAAGAIPYLSQLRCLDMLGLNDAYVARLPDTSESVGHLKLAPNDYIEGQRITYVIGFPRLTIRPDVSTLKAGEFFVRLDIDPEQPVFLAMSTTVDRSALFESLRARGVTVVEMDAGKRK